MWKTTGNPPPSSPVLNLCGCSEWNRDGSRSAVHTGRRRLCLSPKWPAGCEVLWKCFRIRVNRHKEKVQPFVFRGQFAIAHHWGAEWSLCVCHMDAPVPRWCRWQRHFGRWGLRLPSEHEWGSPGLQIIWGKRRANIRFHKIFYSFFNYKHQAPRLMWVCCFYSFRWLIPP